MGTLTSKVSSAWSGLDEAERERLLDLISTIILSITVVLTAFSAWQATLWDGDQAEAYARASSHRSQANAALIDATTEINYDHSTFALAVAEYFRADQPFVDFFMQRLVRDEFRPALETWIAHGPLVNSNAPNTPFDLPEYRNAELEASRALSAEAERELAYGDKANRYGDNYVLSTVFFAAVLFFTGVVTKFKSDSIRFGALTLASVALIGATAFMLTLPRIYQL
jgi:hypothetical protein